MRRVIVVGLAISALVPGLIARARAERKAGRVVRIERGGRGRAISPRLCIEMRGSVDGATGICIGPEPKPGATVEVLDDTRVFGVVRIAETERAIPNCDGLWSVKGQLVAGDLDPQPNGHAIGLIDAGLERRTAHRIAEDRLRAPSGNLDERVSIAVDRDGTGNQLLLITQYTCDAQGQATALGTTQCMDIWAGTASSRMTRVQQTIGCNF